MKYGVIVFLLCGAGVLQTYTYHGVSYLSDSLNGWVSCLDNYPPVIHTSDGWQTWEEQSTGSVYKMLDVYFLNDTLGWLSSLDVGEIRQTIDGGNNWSQQSVGLSKNCARIYFINERHGWAAGEGGIMLRTTNGGTTWDQIFTPIGHTEYYGVYFVDTLSGWLVGRARADTDTVNIDTSCILRTANGGSYWVPQRIDTVYDYLDVRFANINQGWVVGGHRATEQAIILHSTNGGATWNQQSLPGGSYLRAVDFVNNKVGFAVGKNGTTLHTSDGGINWELQNSGVTVTLFDVDFVDSLLGVAVGDSSTILITHNGGDNWNPAGIEENTGFQTSDFRLETYPNPFRRKTVIRVQGVGVSEVKEAADFNLRIYDLVGRPVRTFNHLTIQPFNQIIWDGTDEAGIEVNNGIYFLKFGSIGNTKLIKIK